MKILSIDTSCDETSVAVTERTKILSNVIWSQASAHAKFGGVMPSLAKRMHEERIDWVIDKAIKDSKCKIENLDAIAVTVGPGLSIALGVGIDRAKKLAIKYNKRLIAVNHLEGHILSSLANSDILKVKLPALGLVVSGGNTILVKINKIGSYETLAQTTDDALGEALDKGARMLGLGYPGGAVLEKIAREGDIKTYKLPTPIIGQEERKIFTYSGLKTSFSRLVESEKPLTKENIQNLAACYQDITFTHLIRICSYTIKNLKLKIRNLVIGGGVSANIELKKRLRKLGREFGIKVLFPYSKKLTGDNAAMIGVAAYFKVKRGEFINPEKIDRNPNAKLSD
ncbi:MAG: tRNA (adenosine(37)-N6)-threonylcarbamoyltransferase complex transferase subunit TsaD [Candidatus Microgenomates bacterium]|jgi:N6-L-threonylcarbamoyladenine synthase